MSLTPDSSASAVVTSIDYSTQVSQNIRIREKIAENITSLQFVVDSSTSGRNTSRLLVRLVLQMPDGHGDIVAELTPQELHNLREQLQKVQQATQSH